MTSHPNMNDGQDIQYLLTYSFCNALQCYNSKHWCFQNIITSQYYINSYDYIKVSPFLKSAL